VPENFAAHDVTGQDANGQEDRDDSDSDWSTDFDPKDVEDLFAQSQDNKSATSPPAGPLDSETDSDSSDSAWDTESDDGERNLFVSGQRNSSLFNKVICKPLVRLVVLEVKLFRHHNHNLQRGHPSHQKQ
jgi:hypothetical protein